MLAKTLWAVQDWWLLQQVSFFDSLSSMTGLFKKSANKAWKKWLAHDKPWTPDCHSFDHAKEVYTHEV